MLAIARMYSIPFDSGSICVARRNIRDGPSLRYLRIECADSVQYERMHSVTESLLMRNQIKSVIGKLNGLLVPKSIKANFKVLSKASEARLISSIRNNYLKSECFPPSYCDTEAGRKDLVDHLYGRLEADRRTTIPWLNTLHSLKDAAVLEVGCGTGASTVALAEQGAHVTAVDIYTPSLVVAEERSCLYDLNAIEFHMMNASAMDPLEVERFDIVIFFACMEHMTLDEKLTSITAVWRRLKRGAYLVIMGTPNRLWWYDSHTSLLPFFNWLPDDLAFHYSRYSARELFNSEFRPPIDDKMRLKFTRAGRAMSYHELELAIPDLASMRMACMNEWIRERNPLQYIKWFISGERSFQRTLSRVGPKLPSAMYSQYLTLSIERGEKPWTLPRSSTPCT